MIVIKPVRLHRMLCCNNGFLFPVSVDIPYGNAVYPVFDIPACPELSRLAASLLGGQKSQTGGGLLGFLRVNTLKPACYQFFRVRSNIGLIFRGLSLRSLVLVRNNNFLLRHGPAKHFFINIRGKQVDFGDDLVHALALVEKSQNRLGS